MSVREWVDDAYRRRLEEKQAMSDDTVTRYLSDERKAEIRGDISCLRYDGTALIRDDKTMCRQAADTLQEMLDVYDALASQFAEHLAGENIPKKYIHLGGLTYAVYGTSSIDCAEALQCQLAEAQAVIDKLVQFGSVTQVKRQAELEQQLAVATADNVELLDEIQELQERVKGLETLLARVAQRLAACEKLERK